MLIVGWSPNDEDKIVEGEQVFSVHALACSRSEGELYGFEKSTMQERRLGAGSAGGSPA